tara:strand:- start:376 stop:618 length:243 start_codon:yes stop_codon:yes gene_type:complete
MERFPIPMIRGCHNPTDAVADAVAAVDAVGEEETVVAVVAVVDAVEDRVAEAVEDRGAVEDRVVEADRGVLARTSRSSKE